MRVACAFAAAAVLPLLVGESSTALQNMVMAVAYVIMALGLNVVVGFAGLLDLGYIAFFAIGAHMAAYFGSGFWSIHLNFLAILAIAVVATTLAGVLIGIPTLRVRGAYVGVVTLAFGEITAQIAANGNDISVFGGSLTDGLKGIAPIDSIDLPLISPFSPFHPRPWYWFGLLLVAITLLVNVRLRDSRVGRAWMALRDDEQAAASAGVPIVRTKLAAYGVGAAFGGISGAFLASYLSDVNPGQYTFSLSIFILAMVVLGGLGSIWGVVIGAVLLSAINTYFLPSILSGAPRELGFDFDLSKISAAIYGFLLVAVMLLRPAGLVPDRRGATVR